MTLTLEPSATTLTVRVHDAVDLGGAAVALRLPNGCTYERLLPGTLLEPAGTPLALAGPTPDGSVLAASVLPRGSGPVSGDGTLLALAVAGDACATPPTLLRATAYAVDGTATTLPTSLPSSGPIATDVLFAFAVILTLAKYHVRFHWSIIHRRTRATTKGAE